VYVSGGRAAIQVRGRDRGLRERGLRRGRDEDGILGTDSVRGTSTVGIGMNDEDG
jgi:hypothetical protein